MCGQINLTRLSGCVQTFGLRKVKLSIVDLKIVIMVLRVKVGWVVVCIVDDDDL